MGRHPDRTRTLAKHPGGRGCVQPDDDGSHVLTEPMLLDWWADRT